MAEELVYITGAAVKSEGDLKIYCGGDVTLTLAYNSAIRHTLPKHALDFYNHFNKEETIEALGLLDTPQDENNL